MNDYVRLIRHSDRAWHDRFFSFVASIFKGGRTFSAWGARGGWVDGYDVLAVVVDDQVVSTVGRQSMRYMINGRARNGYQIGAVATHADHRNRGLARLLMNKVLGELDAPDQPVILFANSSVLDFIHGSAFAGSRKVASSGISMCIPRARLPQVWTSQGQQTARGWLIIALEPALSARALPRATTIRPCYFT
jgi:GNAT superfamily N-acetyltransferase